MSDHIADRAGFLAALPRDDAERKIAEAHARSCSACREALEEGGQLILMLREAPPLPPPTDEVLSRASKAIERECARVRRAARVFDLAVAGAVIVAWILQVVNGYERVARDLASLAISFAALAAAIAGASLVRVRQRAVVAAMIGASCLLVILAASTPGLDTRSGLECTLYELIAGAIPWTLALVLARTKGVLVSRRSMMGLAAAGALASQAAQHLTCPVAHATSHLIVFHLGGLILATLLGAVGPAGSLNLAS